MNSSKTVQLGLVQMRAGDDSADNVRRALERVGQAASRGARIVCLQELFATTYFCQREDPDRFRSAESIPGPTSEALAEAAREHEIVLVGSIFEKRAPGLFHNTALVFDADGSLRATYRKMHIPHDPLYYEKYYFAPGDRGFLSVPTRYGRIGPLICWDQWFPEAARLTALAGAQILLYPTAIGWLSEEKAECGEEQREAWEVVQRSHAIASGVFVAAVNRVGKEGGIEFWGSSFACDPFGKVLARAGEGEEVLVVSCDLSRIEAARRDWPFLRDRRTDAYEGLARRWLGE
jgi:N-carbamoylputrescine amidase